MFFRFILCEREERDFILVKGALMQNNALLYNRDYWFSVNIVQKTFSLCVPFSFSMLFSYLKNVQFEEKWHH